MLFSEPFIKDIELQYLRIMTDSLKKGGMDIDMAKKSAQDFLKLLPFEHIEDMRSKLQQYCLTYPELSPITVYMMQKLEENKTSQVLEKMRSLMKNNQIDDALQLAE